MGNTSKYGKIILLKLIVVLILTSVYTQLIPKQYRVNNMSIRKEVKVIINTELNEVKIEGLATFPIINIDNLFQEVEHILLINRIASNMVDMVKQPQQGIMNNELVSYVLRCNAYYQPLHQTDNTLTIEQVAELYTLTNEEGVSFPVEYWNDENMCINENSYMPSLINIHKEFLVQFNGEANNGNGVYFIEINNTNYYLTNKA